MILKLVTPKENSSRGSFRNGFFLENGIAAELKARRYKSFTLPPLPISSDTTQRQKRSRAQVRQHSTPGPLALRNITCPARQPLFHSGPAPAVPSRAAPRAAARGAQLAAEHTPQLRCPRPPLPAVLAAAQTGHLGLVAEDAEPLEVRQVEAAALGYLCQKWGTAARTGLRAGRSPPASPHGSRAARTPVPPTAAERPAPRLTSRPTPPGPERSARTPRCRRPLPSVSGAPTAALAARLPFSALTF